MLVLQSDEFNRSRIQTVIAAAITSNTRLAGAPGNVNLPRRISRLGRDSVINVSQLVTLDREFMTRRVSKLSPGLLHEVEQGVKLVLSL